MTRPKMTVGLLMAMIGLIAAGLGLGLPAREVYLEDDLHGHLYTTLEFMRSAGAPMFVRDNVARPPFWPRYWRRLLGRPWRSQPVCPTWRGSVKQACSFAHPEAFSSPPGKGCEVPREITDDMERLVREWKRDHPAKANPS